MKYLMIFAILFPAIAALGCCNKKISGSLPRLHKYVFISTLVNSLVLWYLVFGPQAETLPLFHFSETLQFTLSVDGLSRVFIMIISVLWPLTALYAFDYMAHEGGEPRFFTFFLVSYGVSSGIALSGNMLTLYMFFELLTLATLPLVMHKMDDKARFAGKRYLVYSMIGASLGFIAIIFVQAYGNGAGFTMGGVMGSNLDPDLLRKLRLAFVFAFFGFGVKAALFPMSFWLPAASVAPTPVTALLHAAAVVKAGAFACIRLTYYSFGTEILKGSFAQYIPMGAAIFTIAFGSVLALRCKHLKRRLAWSTVSNLSYILFAALIMTDLGLKGACMHMLAHAIIKSTLFFGVGCVLVSAEKEYLDEIGGLAGRMPVTFACFTVASLALMGVPPLPGFFSKWTIGNAAAAGGWMEILGLGALMLSAFLTAMYLMTIVCQAYFPANGKLERGTSLEKPRMKIVQIILCVIILAMCVLNPVIQNGLDAWLF